MTNRNLNIIVVVFIALLFFVAGWALHPCPSPVSSTVLKIAQSSPQVKGAVGARYSPVVEALPGKTTKRMTVKRLKEVGVPVVEVRNDNDIIADSGIISDSSDITVKSFVAQSDTVTFDNGSKVQATYTFPSEAPFRFYYRPAPDTTRETTIVVKPEWYEKPLFVSSATMAVLTSIYLIFNKR
jgi:hypothetical protein